MSDALVAKALNDTLGTPEFKGLNTILDRQLGAFNEKFSTTLDDFNSVLKATLDDFAAKEVGRALKISENLYWKEPVELEYERNDSTPVTLFPFVLRFNLDGWVNLAIQTYGQHGKLYVNIYKNGEIFRDYAHSYDGAAKDDFLTACFVRKGDVFEFEIDASVYDELNAFIRVNSVDVYAEEYQFTGMKSEPRGATEE